MCNSLIEFGISMKLVRQIKICVTEFWSVSSPLCVCVRTGKGMYSNTTPSIKMFNDYIRQLHVSAPAGHLQVVFKRT